MLLDDPRAFAETIHADAGLMTPMLRPLLADRYTIERELGAGGMAAVYLAHDAKHDRNVAIKVMREDLAESVGRDRFLREIHLAAKLSHPHILPLYDSGEAAGALYYVMPNVEGQTLRDRMNAGSLPVAEAVRLAAEVAGALDYAHRHDVVHRDIKPENIMLQDGHALVADFGIGKAVSEAGSDTLTQAGLSIGTPAYMSPEQAVGEAVDGRSDVYALGCVLYEMLIGEPPFTGPTAQAIIAKRFVQTPADVQALRDGIPRPVARALQRALARTPIDRFETAAEFAAALVEHDSAGGSASAAAGGGKSLAVLPFTSLSRDADDEMFADGVTEEILNSLAQIPGLRVAGRGSSFSFKGKNEDLRLVGAKLGVTTVLEGTLRRAGSRLRITVQLVDATDGYQLWSERYERVIEDVFAVQDEIAAQIAERLRLSLSSERGAARPRTRSLPAYELYLKGRALLYRRGSSIPKAIECFEQAVALDAEYAQAWAGLADGLTVSAHGGLAPARELMPRALAAARRAVALDDELAEAHSALACATMLYERNDALANTEFRRALELNPNYSQGLAWYGLWHVQWVMGRVEEGHACVEKLLALDALSSYAHSMMAFSDLSSARLPAGVQHARRGAELDPQSFLAWWTYGTALLLSGDHDAAIIALERSLAISGRHIWALALLAAGHARAGRMNEARAVYAEIDARRARGYVQPGLLVVAATDVHGLDAGLAEARRAIDDRDPIFVTIARNTPYVDRLRADSRFQALLRELHYPDFDPAAPGATPSA